MSGQITSTGRMNRGYYELKTKQDVATMVEIPALPLPNVGVLLGEFEHHALDEPNRNIYFDPMLLGFLKTIAISHTDKIFLPRRIIPRRREATPSDQMDYKVDGVVVWGFNKQHNPVALGTVHRSGDKLHFKNERIGAVLQRGNTFRTSVLTRAYSLFNKYYYLSTPAEIYTDGAQAVFGGVQEGRHKVYDMDRMYERFAKLLRLHIEEHLPEFLVIAEQVGSRDGIVWSQFTDYAEKLQEARVINESLEKSKNNVGCVVVLDAEDYHVAPADAINVAYRNVRSLVDAAKILTYTTDTVPVDIKRGVGMLKLLKDETYLDEVGYRLNAKAFYIHNVRVDEGGE